MQEAIYKCKLIGDGKFKPFWATLNEVNGAIKICREFMDRYVFEASSRRYCEIFDLIDHGFGVKGCQSRCGLDGTVVIRHYDKFRKKCWQRPKLRVYNTKLDEYCSKGYFPIPHLKTEECKIKDQSGIHCKEREEIARIFMDKIVSKYFANTIWHAFYVDHFSITMSARYGRDTKYFHDPESVLMAIFDADRTYREYLSRIPELGRILQAKLASYGFGPLFSVMGAIMGPFYDHGSLVNSIITQSEDIGKYTISAITTNSYTYVPQAPDAWGFPFNDSNPLHLFDQITDLAKQCKKDGNKLESVHIVFNLPEKYRPVTVIKPVITTPLRKDECV